MEKRCKNCAHFDRWKEPQQIDGGWVYGGCGIDYEYMYTWPNRICQHSDEFRDRTTTPEYRHEQLEKLAVSMFYDLDPYSAAPYAAKLKALGVKLDD